MSFRTVSTNLVVRSMKKTIHRINIAWIWLGNYCFKGMKMNQNLISFHFFIGLIINRNHDYENFLATLLIRGQSERRSAFAIRAFNVEIAKVAGSVHTFS